MRQASKRIPESAEKTVRDIRRATRRHHSAEEKIRIVLEGLRGEDSIAELCRKEGINQNLYYRWSKEFLEAGKKRLAGDTARENEIFRIREVRDHRTGGTVVALNPPDTGSNRDPEIDVLRLVQPIPRGRDRSSGGWQAETAADLEQDL